MKNIKNMNKFYFINDFSTGSVIVSKEDFEKGDFESNLILVKSDGYYNHATKEKIFETEDLKLFTKLWSEVTDDFDGKFDNRI